MDISYRVNTIICIFNVMDTIGRKFPEFVPLKKESLPFLVFLRFIFIVSFPIVAGMSSYNYWFSENTLSVLTIINMVLFSFTNGYLTSTFFSLAPEQVPEELKGKSGSSLSLFLIIGIFSGSLYATFVMQNIF